MPRTTARVKIHLRDQFRHRVNAIAHHFRRVAASSGNELIANHQQAVIVTRHIAFHQNIVAEFGGDGIGLG